MGADHEHRVCSYLEASELFSSRERFFVNDCYCRRPAKEGKAAWTYCGHPLETCMSFQPPANPDPDWPVSEIPCERALELFEEWKRSKHIFRFMYDPAGTAYLCFCCACGCGWFRDKEGLRMRDPCGKGPFIERTDGSACTLCGDCVDVCGWEARSTSEGEMRVMAERCYGCGACENVCAEKAITMFPR